MSKIKIDEKEFKQILKAIKDLKNGKFNVSLETKDDNASLLSKEINSLSKGLHSLENYSLDMYTELTNGNLDYRIDSRAYKKGYGNILENINA